MGFAYVNVTVRGMKASRDVRMLAGTGSTYIVLDPETIKELGLLETPYAVDLLLADGGRSEPGSSSQRWKSKVGGDLPS
jgi:predicted aspartyl protease